MRNLVIEVISEIASKYNAVEVLELRLDTLSNRELLHILVELISEFGAEDGE